jgi:hypothetical protein
MATDDTEQTEEITQAAEGDSVQRLVSVKNGPLKGHRCYPIAWIESMNRWLVEFPGGLVWGYKKEDLHFHTNTSFIDQ